MRLSRPCYNKPHRCPGWAGGGELYAKVQRCEGGRLNGLHEKRLWRWRFNRCGSCDVVVLPYAVRLLDWRWWQTEARRFMRDVRYSMSDYFNGR